jgi:hypothetical protein
MNITQRKCRALNASHVDASLAWQLASDCQSVTDNTPVVLLLPARMSSTCSRVTARWPPSPQQRKEAVQFSTQPKPIRILGKICDGLTDVCSLVLLACCECRFNELDFCLGTGVTDYMQFKAPSGASMTAFWTPTELIFAFRGTNMGEFGDW